MRSLCMHSDMHTGRAPADKSGSNQLCRHWRFLLVMPGQHFSVGQNSPKDVQSTADCDVHAAVPCLLHTLQIILHSADVITWRNSLFIMSHKGGNLAHKRHI